MDKHFYLDVTKSFIRALRAKRSQNDINRKLGFSQNIVSKWELGTRRVAFDEFLLLCKVLNIPVSKKVKHIFNFRLISGKEAELISFLVGRLNKKELSECTFFPQTELSKKQFDFLGIDLPPRPKTALAATIQKPKYYHQKTRR